MIDIKKRDYEYRLIDGNWTYHPTAYCTYYKGFLTQKLSKTHRCKERMCKRYIGNIDFDKLEKKQEEIT